MSRELYKYDPNLEYPEGYHLILASNSKTHHDILVRYKTILKGFKSFEGWPLYVNEEDKLIVLYR